MQAKLVHINADKADDFYTLDIALTKGAQTTFHGRTTGNFLVIFNPTWQDMRSMVFVLLDATGGRR